MSAWAPPPTFDEFRVLRPLGAGTAGQVYLCHDATLQRSVAVKFLRAAGCDALTRERVLTEARAIARLSHPNVVTIHRVGEWLGVPYLVYEWIAGRSLAELPLPVPWQEALRIGLELARALAAAHRRGVLHRDIKPANALLADDGAVKLLDFGVAKLASAVDGQAPAASAPADRPAASAGPPRAGAPAADATASLDPPPAGPPGAVAGGAGPTETAPGGPALTLRGAAIGTPRYMAPEAWGGAPCQASDVYSLGAVLYELCAGRPPHPGQRAEEVRASALTRDAAPLAALAPGTDPAFAALVDRCLRRDPALRPASGDALCSALLALRPSPLAQPPAPPDEPYRGLLPFHPEHAALFFGRDAEAGRALGRLRDERVLVIAGDSGVGKTSLCQAAVLPRLVAGALGRPARLAALRPGRAPLLALGQALEPLLQQPGDELAAQLRRQPQALLPRLRDALGPDLLALAVDPLEELLTQAPRDEAALFCEVLLALSQLPAVRIVASLRGDFVTRMAVLWPELEASLFLLGPPGPGALREAIVGPARACGYAFESEADVEALLSAGEGGLPLLQFALQALWEARDPARRLIPSAALLRMGGLGGALGRHADQVVAALLPEQRRAARRLLRRLVTAEGTRRRCTADELLGPDPAERAALAGLLRGRLLVVRQGGDAGAAYELAHEALLRDWGTLREWLDRDQERRALLQRLAAATAEWERVGGGREALWGERQLLEVDAAALQDGELPVPAAAFLRACRRERRRRRLLSRGLLFFTPLVLVTLVASLSLWRLADLDQRRAAEAAQAETGLRALLLSRQPGREVEALAAAVQAAAPALAGERAPGGPAAAGLLAAVAAGRESLLLRHAAPVQGAAFSADGARLATVAEDGAVRVWDPHTGEPLRAMSVPGGGLRDVSFSPAGDRLLTAGVGAALIFDARTGARLAALPGRAIFPRTTGFSPDGRRLLLLSGPRNGAQDQAQLFDAGSLRPVAALPLGGGVRAAGFSRDGQTVLTAGGSSVRLWRAEDGSLLHDLRHERDLSAAALSPAGDVVAAGRWDGQVQLWDARAGRPVRALPGRATPIVQLAFSPDGTLLAAAGQDASVRVWDTRGWTSVAMAGPAAAQLALGFAPSGDRLLTGGWDGVPRLFDPRSGQLLSTLRGHRGLLTEATFSPDGRFIVSASQDRSARLFHGGSGTRLSVLRGHQGAVLWAAFTPAGDQILSAGQDGTVRVYAAGSGRLLRTLSCHERGVTQGALSRDGRLVTRDSGGRLCVWDLLSLTLLRRIESPVGSARAAVSLSPDGRRAAANAGTEARVWDLQTGELLGALGGHHDDVAAVAFSPDGRRVATASHDHTARLFDGASLQAVATLLGHAAPLNAARFSPDGALLATASDDGTVRLWGAAGGADQAALRGHRDEVWDLDFSPDGRRLASASADRTVAIWDLSRRARLLLLAGHAGPVERAIFSPDGASLVSVSEEPAGRLWDARTGALRQDLLGHRDLLRGAAFSPDGARLVTSSADGTARLFDVGRAAAPPPEGPELLVPVGDEGPGDEGPGGQGPGGAAGPPPDLAALRRALALACRLLRHQPEFDRLTGACGG